jgi:ATP-binding cassette subfamily B (MDR/TAP) protein 9
MSQPQDSDSLSRLPAWKLGAFLVLLFLDGVISAILLTSLFPGIARTEYETSQFTFYGSLLDLFWLALARLTLAAGGLLVAFLTAEVPPEWPFSLYHANGEKKSREELENEALEEPFGPWFRRWISRPAVWGEFLCIATQVVCVTKCLARMNVEIGLRSDEEASHPLFWIAVCIAAVFSVTESMCLEDMCRLSAEYGKYSLGEAPTMFAATQNGSSLTVPLLSSESLEEQDGHSSTPVVDEDARGTSDIGADTSYKANWRDLSHICYPDIHMICVAFVFLLLAAMAQVYIPRFLGKILDSLAAAFANANDDKSKHESITEIPGFLTNIKLLTAASLLAGIFSGCRGSIFTVVGARVNVRLRVQLMDALLHQDIGFFDVTKTGDITSRLSSDTTLVGDQVSLNVNVFLRSVVQAIGVLVFMFVVSWQLSILAFISVPLITVLSKWYGNYVRSLTKLMQKLLAEGNSVSEAAFGAIATVRTFDAAELELAEFEACMEKYLAFNNKAAIAYCGYAAFTVALPQLVFALVVFYGGLLVRNGDMTSGDLVSFLLYLSSLSDAFASIGYVFSSLTQAVGAADKVFELLHRKPRIRPPTETDEVDIDLAPRGLLGIRAEKVHVQRLRGLRPESCRGEIELDDVVMYYPSRPQRCVLDGLSLKIEPGSVVALVGQSGGGKSSIVSLVQHLYEQSSGRVMLDGHDVHQLSPTWLSRHVSVVSQQPTLFGRSIRRNIMYGLEGTDEEPSQEAIEEAAKLASAHEFIDKMPQKYDTEVGERGVQLSGGQRQRIAIARALVRKPRVLLLDEATSALDAESEFLVQQAIDNMLSRGKDGGSGITTIIVIAHRLSTVRNADRIYVIKEGKVVEEGSHVDLSKDPQGHYSLLIRRQVEAHASLEEGASNGHTSN